ncbi:putative ankyrin repeat-containing domain, PGG domain, ankyrin repeat-containing domain superfamily [Helianthus annuus]|uniref:Ankyrin repeat-containing domain, PGG domain, ankyrin repeat-containing domain superfamily n=1 Tax=Helianthus annuus TaxID=4232 RepID=A0A251TT42_HELAN|nr:putative ankyrin repeat-containing domain, PGG domain, ankyrin repeat-containing domain superfamily [Helianthus annuus]KAJ0541095.1 putative ankyrin repeat-containing domain, PGG domain, ankyrin repeat-containing domain superfamily [Helianthus annuus]KAJ0706181.1 putative ankyrin repeat-containing domain, PGG domain, ankyrin repeat-containing domain superfamily [Helianthus annuus]KAJ0886649.1 putative ankyrin repeat-containing domain, PGG domain, ankyrin repeat-containing domain superfamily [
MLMLQKIIRKGDWSKMERILKGHNHLVTEAISTDSNTMLHYAVGIYRNDFLKKLIFYMNGEQVLKPRTSDGSTALHIAATVGNTRAANLLVKKNSKLLEIPDHNAKTPLQNAYENMHLYTIDCLLKAVMDGSKPKSPTTSLGCSGDNIEQIEVDLLVNAISAKHYSLASKLVTQHPTSASKSEDVLMPIAKTFPSGLDYWESLVYPPCMFLVLAVWPFKHIENKKKEWDEAKEVVKKVCNQIDKKKEHCHSYYTRAILEAACQNAYKVVAEILKRSPRAIQSRDKRGYDIVQLAIMHRSEKIYNLIYDVGERRNLYRTYEDSSKNNILHLTGKLAPSSVLNQRRGAALQLQRELQWEHEKLVKEAEQWMKTTAESFSITAALITTIVSAAAITVPGGSSEDKGTPLFKKEPAFIIFSISDAISLFASSTALLVFLSILTARFAEKDFLVSLPRRLFIGLFSLLVSTTTMMIAFSATLFLVFCEKKSLMLAPICGLAFIPIAFFVSLHFPLLVDLLKSTYSHISGNQRKRILKSSNPDDHVVAFL